MKKLLLITGITLVTLAAANYPHTDFSARNKHGIKFHQGNWEEALTLAKKENKLIFLDIYASWCGPCKAMKRRTFSDTEVGGYYNVHYINVAIDAEKGEGIALAKKYKISAYPTLLFINADGEQVAGTTGYHNPRQLIKLGKKMLKK